MTELEEELLFDDDDSGEGDQPLHYPTRRELRERERRRGEQVVQWSVSFALVVLIGLFGWGVSPWVSETIDRMNGLKAPERETIEIEGERPTRFDPNATLEQNAGALEYTLEQAKAKKLSAKDTALLLVANGFPKGDIEYIPETTSIDLVADSFEVAVLVGDKDCLAGGTGNDSTAVSTAIYPKLHESSGNRSCLAGNRVYDLKKL